MFTGSKMSETMESASDSHAIREVADGIVPGRLYSEAAAMHWLGVCRVTMGKLRASGKLRAFRCPGLRYRGSDLLKFVDASAVKPKRAKGR
jgi:hypothetical protein